MTETDLEMMKKSYTYDTDIDRSEVLHQNLHVADTIVAGFDMVVSKVLGQVGWVYST